MTEAEWLACDEPDVMLAFIRGKTSRALRRRPSLRKLRLFTCACCRRIWKDLDDTCSRTAVEVAERYVERLASGSALEAAWSDAVYRSLLPEQELRWAAVGAASSSANAADSPRYIRRWTERQQRPGEGVAQANLLRCILGNPFRPVGAEPPWLAWKTCTISQLAQAIYEDRTFGQLPILADALEEAGCDNADILAHCRSGGEHVRGCWVLDSILGKT